MATNYTLLGNAEVIVVETAEVSMAAEATEQGWFPLP
jgi:hypothetical protein